MSKVAVVFWSGSGNTEAMANAVAEGAKGAGAQVDLMTSDEFSAAKVKEYDAIGFGCPSMGVEVLEESSFEPMFAEVESSLSGKNIALFGSFGWGDGQWMRDWSERCEDDGANQVADFVICNETPNDDGLASCRALGEALAK